MYFVFVITRTDGSAYAIKLHAATKEEATRRARADCIQRFHSMEFKGECADLEERGLSLYEKACTKADKICKEAEPKKPEPPKEPEQKADPKTGVLF